MVTGAPLRGAAGARASADMLVAKLQAEVQLVKDQHQQLLDSFSLVFGDPNLADRVLAIVPALGALLAGRAPSHVDVLRRNVALHAVAPGCRLSTAPADLPRAHQKGPRLEGRAVEAGDRVQPKFVWNVEAPVFVPWRAPGCWELPSLPGTMGEDVEL
ncbi:unnamed protein product [Prorocentrum cordatum]|uniref:Uncharacterized protein n=1 Tax=Prorocentrum cordatum TaxID=2364126 RepID=A0ABN9YF07_9DINO|nr:unnamed protein product [Polarella glacialis]